MKIKVYKNKKLVEVIDRKPFNRGFIGNFIPHWCRYKGKEHLIHGSIDHAYLQGYQDDAYIIL